MYKQPYQIVLPFHQQSDLAIGTGSVSALASVGIPQFQVSWNEE